MTDRRTRLLFVVGVLVSLVVAVGISQFASSDPDGLEYVAEQQGFADQVQDHDFSDFGLADYGDGLTGNDVVDTAIAGLVGVLVTLGIGWVVFRVARRRDDVTTG